MQEDVRAFVASCVKCQKNRPFKDQPVVLCPVPPPSNALSQWDMDLIKLPETEDGYNYLIVAIDHLTKWPEVQPLKSKTAADVLVSSKMIKNGLRKTLEGRHKEWPKFVNRVLYGIRLHRPRSTRQLPYKLLYGFDARFSLDNKLDQLNQVPDDDAETTEEADDERLRVFLQGVDKHNEEIDNCRSEARENIIIEQSKQKTTYDAAHAACPFKVGSKVLLHSS
uniref:Integrase zinc-binding domain-containing protein n=1 Tax=Plectus sambesii TaxID=2011161 RepID=A0A914X9K6_9BILA